MSLDATPQWYLEAEGRRTGPYSAEQIEAMLRDGQLPPDALVSGRGLRGPARANEFIEAIRLRRQTQSQKRAAGPAAIQPPPRPEGVGERRRGTDRETAPSTDPTADLFDALQHIRERQTLQQNQTQRLIPAENETWSDRLKARGLPSPAVLVASLAALLGLSVWSLNQWLGSAEKSAKTQANSTEGASSSSGNPTFPEKGSAGRSAGSSPAMSAESLRPVRPSTAAGFDTSARARTVLPSVRSVPPPSRGQSGPQVDRDIEIPPALLERLQGEAQDAQEARPNPDARNDDRDRDERDEGDRDALPPAESNPANAGEAPQDGNSAPQDGVTPAPVE
jgi:hypothetical protein